MIKSPLLDSLAAYVDGKWVHSASLETFDVTNPADNNLLCSVPKLTGQETVGAIAAAEASQANLTTIEQRAEWLSRLADLVLENKLKLDPKLT